jgi:UDP-N-acetylmuramoyl-tripeptide--D-alanyl-D-alanine ligase
LLHLKDLPTVAYEEGLALQYVAHHQGCIAICLDDPWIAPHFETLQKKYKNLSHPQKIIPYSLSHLSRPFEVLQGQLSTNGQTLSVTGFGLLNATFPLPLLGQHNAKNLLGAIAIALQLELSAEEIQKGLPHFKPTEGRSIIQPLPGPIQVLCDYYNAQPASVLAGIQLLVDMSQAQPTRGRRWVCLADMRELEPQHELLHRSLAPPLIQHGIENVLLYGTNMAFLFDELKQKNYIGIKKHFTSKADLANFLLTHVQPHDTILIKGSNSMQMVDVWKTLSQGMAHRKE